MQKNRRLLIDCSFISTTKLNTGIQRVVRKTIENIYAITKDSNFEPVEVTLDTHTIKQISMNNDTKTLNPNIISRQNDILLLIDSTWHLDTWKNIKQIKQNGTKIVAVIYDLIPISHPQFCDENLVKLFKKWFEIAINYIDGFIAISNTVQLQLEEYIKENFPQKASNKKYYHFLLGADFDYKNFNLDKKTIKSNLEDLYKKNKNIYLIVCTIEPRKNHKYLLDVFDKLWNQNVDVTLNIVGKKGWMVEKLIARIKTHKMYNKKLFYWDNLNDEELNYCYKNSKMLLFPSFIEGFGLPIIESLNNKLPVMASDIPIHREIGNGHIDYFNINNSDDLTEKIIDIEKNGIPEYLKIKADFKWLTWYESTEELFRKINQFDNEYVLDDDYIFDDDISIDEIINNINEEDNSSAFVKKDVYTYEDFTPYNNEEFITNIYQAFLHRKPDAAGLNNFLQKLKSGEQSKMQIITLIRSSKEARLQGIKLEGFKKRLLVTKFLNFPLLSELNRSIYSILRISQNQKRYNALENHFQAFIEDYNKNEVLKKDYIDKSFSLSSEKTNNLERITNTRIEEQEKKFNIANQNFEEKQYILEQNLEDKISIEDSKDLYAQLLVEKNNITIALQKLDTLILQAKNNLPQQFDEKQLEELIKINSENKFSKLYKSFEDKFRGSNQEIKNRLSIYLAFLNQYKDDTSALILDIGCGRGEWLELLKENNLKAIGIDNNPNILDSISQDFNIKQADALAYLKSQEDSSLSVITGFHIIEHIPFDMILEILEQSLRVLKTGGMIIFETPNPRNILVGASDFYLDPSHKAPLHPMTMKFFTKQIGFTDVKALIINNNKFKEIDEIDFNKLEDYVTIGRDYCIIGYKI